MFHIHVLRIKCEGLLQGDLLRKESDPVSVIAQSFEWKPTAHVGRGSEWHIGNVEAVEARGLGFAMGRTQAVKTPQFDTATHDFLEEEATRAPFTLGVFDRDTQACGIIRANGVSQNAREVAGKLEKLLNAAPFAKEANRQITVEPMPDPVNFVDAINGAAAVTRFGFTVTRPNPQDVNKLIQGPAKEFTKEIGGDRSRVEVEGGDLDKDVIESVAKAVAADGEDAYANVRQNERGPSKRIHLAGNPVVEPVEASPGKSMFVAILDATRRAYRRVRGDTQL